MTYTQAIRESAKAFELWHALQTPSRFHKQNAKLPHTGCFCHWARINALPETAQTDLQLHLQEKGSL